MTPRARRALAASSLSLSLAAVVRLLAVSPALTSPPPTRSRARISGEPTPGRGRQGLGRGRAIAWGPAPYETRFRALWNDGGPLPALRRRRLLALAHDDAPRRAPLGGGGRGDLPRPRPLGPALLRARDQPGQRRLRPADDRRPRPRRASSPGTSRGCETRVAPREGQGRTDHRLDRAPRSCPGRASVPLPSAARSPCRRGPGDAGASTCSASSGPAARTLPEKGAVEVAWSKPPGRASTSRRSFRDLVSRAAR